MLFLDPNSTTLSIYLLHLESVVTYNLQVIHSAERTPSNLALSVNPLNPCLYKTNFFIIIKNKIDSITNLCLFNHFGKFKITDSV